MIEPNHNIERFSDVAKRYCAWAESSPAEIDIVVAQKLLAELHVAIIDLTDIGCGEETTDAISHNDWMLVLERFQELPIDQYWDVFDPFEVEEPVLNLLSDDLADIYRDIKEGLILYQNGQIVEAVWDWRFKFSVHWGAHMTGAQRAIHSYLTNY